MNKERFEIYKAQLLAEIEHYPLIRAGVHHIALNEGLLTHHYVMYLHGKELHVEYAYSEREILNSPWTRFAMNRIARGVAEIMLTREDEATRSEA